MGLLLVFLFYYGIAAGFILLTLTTWIVCIAGAASAIWAPFAGVIAKQARGCSWAAGARSSALLFLPWVFLLRRKASIAAIKAMYLLWLAPMALAILLFLVIPFNRTEPFNMALFNPLAWSVLLGSGAWGWSVRVFRNVSELTRRSNPDALVEFSSSARGPFLWALLFTLFVTLYSLWATEAVFLRLFLERFL